MVDGPEILRHAVRMLVRVILILHRVVLVAALTVALVATGFAHRMPGPQDEALAFALANGASLADICGDDLGGADHRASDCQACRIAGSADLPPASQTLVDLNLAFHAAVVAPRESFAQARVIDLANRPQGPPVA